jgi:hypothetical protein
VGASTWASGSHTWKGNIGIFTAKAKKQKSQRIFCFSKEKFEFNKMS